MSQKFQVVIPEYETIEIVEAYDEGDALQTYCEEADRENDMIFARCGVKEAWVRAYPNGEWKHCELEVREVPEYQGSLSTRQRVKDDPKTWANHYCQVCFERLDHESCKGVPEWGPPKEALEQINSQ